MIFNDVIGYSYLFFLYILPWLLLLLVFGWFRDWIVSVYQKWKANAEKVISEGKEEKWIIILELMKIIQFVVLALPIFAIIDYFLDDTVADPGPYLFNSTMFQVFLVVTAFNLLGVFYYGIYERSKRDVEEEERMREELSQ